MRNTATLDQPRGIQYTLFAHLKDLDYADDLAVLSTNHAHIQEKTTSLNNHAIQSNRPVYQQDEDQRDVHQLDTPLSFSP